jgi:hypothetical protein
MASVLEQRAARSLNVQVRRMPGSGRPPWIRNAA